jgi:hypothetical protein
MKKNLYTLLILFGIQVLTASNPNNPIGFVSPKDVFGTRNFIENKGQYDKALNGNYTIEAVLDNGAEKIYFTTEGLVYELVKKFPLTEKQREAMEKDKHSTIKPPKIYHVNMSWLNAQPNIRVEKSEKQSHYFTYGEAKYNSYAYKKLTYKNVYPHIDIEYSIPENKDYGIKYNVIVNPGANVADIKIAYTGDVDKIKQTQEGNILIKTPLDDITEYAPNTFYENKQRVESAFILKDNFISFNFPNGYNQNKTVIIDPFVSSVTTLISNNLAFDVDYDYSGNTYVYGADANTNNKVAKYSSSGVLLWTFFGTIASISWQSSPNGYDGNFVVNKAISKIYIGQGFNGGLGGGCQLVRLDATGNYDNFMTLQSPNFEEIWDMGFSCINNEVFGLGGGTTYSISAVTINPTTAAIGITNFQPSISNAFQDVASHAIDDAGNIFVIYGSGAFFPNGNPLNDNICAVNSTFNGNLWTQPSTFVAYNEVVNKSAYFNYTGQGSNGFNGLAVNNDHLFYYDGSNLAAYGKITGSLIASTTVPALILMQQGGIAVDDCNNLYIGGNGSILSYNFNGNSFSALSSIPINASGLNQYVYDIKLDKFSNLLYVSGNGFVGTYAATNSNSCPVSSSACYAANQNYSICSGASVTLVPVNFAALSNPIYSLNPGGLTSTIGSFVVNPSVTTTYTTYVIGTNTLSTTQTISTVSNINVNPLPNIIATSNLSTICYGQSSTITASGAISYTWNTNATTSVVVVSPLVTTIYTVNGLGVNGCVNTATSNIIVNNIPTITVNNGSVCVGQSFTLNPSGANTYTSIRLIL